MKTVHLTGIRQLEISRVYMTDKIDSRLEVAKKAGAIWAANPMHSNIVKFVKEREPFLLDAVFECCGDQDALDLAVDLLKPGGTLFLYTKLKKPSSLPPAMPTV